MDIDFRLNPSPVVVATRIVIFVIIGISCAFFIMSILGIPLSESLRELLGFEG